MPVLLQRGVAAGASAAMLKWSVESRMLQTESTVK